MDAIALTSAFHNPTERHSILRPVLVLAALCLLSLIAAVSDPEGFAELISYT